MLAVATRRTLPFLAVAALALGGCVMQDKDENADATTSEAPPAQSTPAPPPRPDLLLEVNIADRAVHVYKGEQRIASHPAAVGSTEWPTPTGEWTIDQVIFNPRWVPPREESWAKDEKESEPGAPDNPLGVVQLVYNIPNTIHGTYEPESLGKAVSHGSVRVSNEVGVELARQVMQAGGAAKDDAFIQNALKNKTERVDVPIPNGVPIRVVAGSATTTTQQ